MEELAQIEPHAPINPVPKGTLVASPHRERKLLYLVKSGSVRLYKLSDGGKELTLDVLGMGHLFGEVGSFTTGATDLFAETLEDSVICTIDRAQLEQLMSRWPKLALKFIEMVAIRLKEVEEMLEHIAYGSVRKRILYLLHKLSRKFGVAVPEGEGLRGEPGWIQLKVKLTHQELASMMGSIRETVTDLLNELSGEGIVYKGGPRRPLCIQPERLIKALEDCK